MFDRDFQPGGGGSTEASTSVTGPPEEGARRREVYYALPMNRSAQSREGEESYGRHRSQRRRLAKPPGKQSETTEDPEEFGDVDEVVVDNSFEIGGPQESLTEPSAGPGVTEHQPTMQPGQGKAKGGAFGWDPKDRQNGLNLSSSHTHSAHDTNSVTHTGITSAYLQSFLRTLRYAGKVVYGVFFPQFDDHHHEKQFVSQEWYLGKMLALIAACFLIANWVLACIFIPRPFILFDYIFNFGIAPVLTLPLPILIVLRWPIRRPVIYQIYLVFAVWSQAWYSLLSLILCGFYSKRSYFSCGRKDFLGIFFYATGFPCLALFALGQKRFPAALAASATIIVMGACVVPYRESWVRLVVNMILFNGFIIYVHWAREMSDRDRFIMSRQIKDAYLYRHRLQMREKQIQNSKQRLTGYIFHEVRVPLNTAMLAVQNIEASGTVSKPLELEFNALMGSLTVMSKVLNDVLDLNRMDAGKFESVSKPYAFHKVIESLLVPLRLAASAKGLQLIENLDPRIDEFVLGCLIRAKKAKGVYDESEEIEPLVVGDEMRCRQIFTNFTSNATKFCPPGGRIEVVTKLLWPSPPGVGAVAPVGPGDSDWFPSLSERVSSNGTVVSENGHTNGHANPTSTPTVQKLNSSARIPIISSLKDRDKQKPRDSIDEKHMEEEIAEKPSVAVPIDQIVIRIEVRDTGTGIKKKDIRDAKLFSPYVQTEIGRHQGGKGTGLGLALVRRIVKLSGGRLGVKSKYQQGSCFWVELPLKVGTHALMQSDSGSRDVSIRSRSIPPTRARDFALDQSSINTGPTVNDSLLGRPAVYSPPAPHISHRTIMEQQGLVEMTPSRPELRYRKESPLGDAIKGTSSGNLASIPSHYSDPHVLSVAHSLEPPQRTDTSSSAPAAIEANTASAEAFDNQGAAEPRTPTPKPLEVLVVDDDALTRRLMTRLLTRLGCIVTTAENGVKALELLLGSMFTPSEAATPSTLIPGTPGASSGGTDQITNQPRFYDVVFLDNQMPQMSGLEAIARLRAAGREDLVVGVTGNALIRDQDEYLNAGVDHVLIKPVLEKSLRQMLSLAQRRRTAGVLDETLETGPE